MSVAIRDSAVTAGLLAEFPVTVSIYNGTTTTTGVSAIVNSTTTWGAGASVTHGIRERREYDIAVADYAFGGTATEPAEGHTITDADGVVWEVHVAEIDGNPKPWRYVNQSRNQYRIECWRGWQ